MNLTSILAEATSLVNLSSIPAEAASLVKPPPAAIFTVLWCGILLVACGVLLWYVVMATVLDRAIAAQIRSLDSVKDKEAADRFNLIQRGFASSSFKPSWDEFAGTLIVKRYFDSTRPDFRS